MKTKKYIFTILAFMFCFNIFAKDKLITIYDNDCGFCQNLLYETYQNDLVKDKLSVYEHLLFEAQAQKGIEYIKQYNITSYPTQIIIKNGETTLLKGYLNSEQQLEFLNKPIEFKEKLNSEQNMLLNQQDDFLPKKFIKFLGATIDSANSSDRDPFEGFMKILKRLIDGKKIKVDDLNKFVFENIDKLVCENHDTIKIRKFSTILKYAIDTKNYDFIRGALFIKQNGENVCNPYIDFTRKEIIDGQEETLIQFIDKLLNDERMSAVHDFGAINNIKIRVEGCTKWKENNKKYEESFDKSKTEVELRKARLEYAENFSEGLAVLKLKTNDYKNSYYIYKYGYINKEGAIVIPLIYTFAYPFKNCKAKVANFRSSNSNSIYNYYINTDGKCIEDCE